MAVLQDNAIRKLLLLFLVFTGLYLAREFLIPFALGALLAALFLPLCRYLERLHLPPLLAALVCLLAALLAISAIGALLGWQISLAMEDISLLRQKSQDAVDSIRAFLLEQFGIGRTGTSDLIREQQGLLRSLIESVAGSLIGLFTGFILTFVYLVLFLYYRKHIREFIFRVTPNLDRADTQHMITQAARVSQQYLAGLSKMIFCLWIMYGIGFSLVGVENALFFAILCGLLEIVPFIGNLTGTSITLLITAAHGAGLPVLGGIVITYGTVQFIQGWVLEPLILGPQVRINPLFTIIVLVIGELLWGIPGIVLAIPLTAIFKIVCDEIDVLKPYGFLVGETARRNPPAFISRIRERFSRKKTG